MFTCLSHDIIAHETAHALLDGMHRRLRSATNPDMLAFHEAFADIVALFQHFTFPEILRHQIAQTRGDIRSQQNVLGQLASQFGRATGLRGALRDAIGRFDESGTWRPHERDPRELERTTQPHDRGAILVAAVFDAFLSIYASRVADLLRLATGGSGILPAGAIHPDLVNRLAEEAGKSADHILTMCVRALDYCPPVDLTFGEYLRALITADIDLYPEDERHYRVAFVEAFRQRGIYPRDVRALSVENLCWRRVEQEIPGPSPDVAKIIAEHVPQLAAVQQMCRTREEIFEAERKARMQLQQLLYWKVVEGERGAQDAQFLGLERESFEVHSARLATRPSSGGEPRFHFIIGLTQTRKRTAKERSGRERESWFEGGSTVIVDVLARRIVYCVRKPLRSSTRQARQAAYEVEKRGRSLWSTYFGDDGVRGEPFALLHRGAL